MDNHYKWLEQNLESFFKKLNIGYSPGIIVAHGDKCYSYRMRWDKAGIPFHHGVAIYLLCYHNPYSKEVRETANGWVKPDDWVMANYSRFKQFLNP